MKIRAFRFNSTTTMLVVCAILLLTHNMLYADVCQIIKIEEVKGAAVTRVEIIPEKITVPVGTCTVWINWVARKEVQVSFRENAKQCIFSTEASTGFSENELKAGETCYISESLPRGKTASLVWSKPGLYKYTIELENPTTSLNLPGKVSTEGVIEVK